MYANHSRHVALTGLLAEWADSRAAEGEHASVSDLVRTAIRLHGEQDRTRRAGAGAGPSTTAVNHV